MQRDWESSYRGLVRRFVSGEKPTVNTKEKSRRRKNRGRREEKGNDTLSFSEHVVKMIRIREEGTWSGTLKQEKGGPPGREEADARALEGVGSGGGGGKKGSGGVPGEGQVKVEAGKDRAFG